MVPPNESVAKNGFVFIYGASSVILCVASVIAGIAHFMSLFTGADYSLIDFSKPHRAVLSKDNSGKYFVGVCRFPFWTDVPAYGSSSNTEENAIKRYEELKKKSAVARQKKLESGPIRVLAEPTSKSITKTDTFEYIADILNQYAPDKVEAIRKLKEVFDK